MSAAESPVRRAALRVRLLGGFEVEGLTDRALGTRKSRVLLKRLAAGRGHPVPVEELVEAVWADTPPAHPAQQLGVLVSRLRAVLGPHRIRRTEVGYELRVDWLDVLELEERAAEVDRRLQRGQPTAAAAVAQAALGLARGPLLPEEDDPWAELERRSVARIVLRLRLSAAGAALATGDPVGARFAAERALDDEPYDESALRLVMRSYAAAGSGAAALAAYARFRRRLAEDLGADPASETTQLHLAILTGALPAPAPPETEVVGRDEELRRLDYALQTAAGGGTSAVVVEAVAGMGKSALLSAWTRSAAVAQAFCVVGRCDEVSRDLPLQPVIDAVQVHLDAPAAAAALLGPDGPLLERLFVGASPRWPDGGTSLSDLDSDRRALFGALLDLLRRLAGSRPVVLVLDDVHLAARGTSQFLAYALMHAQRLAVVCACRPGGEGLPTAAERVVLGPLDEAATAKLVGGTRAAKLYERTGGHPLFLVALADRDDDELPQTVLDAVQERFSALGEAAATVQVAALLGRAVDVDLLAAVVGRSVDEVLDDLDVALHARVLEPRDMTLVFAHEVVREAMSRTTSPARATRVHTLAAAALSRRQHVDPLRLARHARLAGESGSASQWLIAAADVAFQRYDVHASTTLLDEAISLADSGGARVMRARIRLSTGDFPAARVDALRALELGSGAPALELAGWVSYYARDYDAARRYADEGVERSTDQGIKASCLALAGRIRHARGELLEAEDRLERAVVLATPQVRGVAQVWHSSLLVHVGRTDEAIEVARRGLLEPVRSHPFAALAGRFALAHALGLTGRWADALDVLDDLDAEASRMGETGKRFPPVAANVRGWLLRAVGALDRAVELHERASATPLAPEFREPYYAALLDLTEDWLAAGDLDRAALALDRARQIRSWKGTMSWRHRMRLDLVDARFRLASGDVAGAEQLAHVVVQRAGELHQPRYLTRAVLLRDVARARRGVPVAAVALLDGQAVSSSAEFFPLDEALVLPAPAEPVPILVGGRSDAAVRRAARLGDGWPAIWVSPRRWAQVLELVDEQAIAAERGQIEWRHELQAWVGFGSSREQARERLAKEMQAFYGIGFESFERYSPYGRPEDVAQALASYVEAGCRSFNLIPGGVPDDEAAEAVAEVRRLLR